MAENRKRSAFSAGGRPGRKAAALGIAELLFGLSLAGSVATADAATADAGTADAGTADAGTAGSGNTEPGAASPVAMVYSACPDGYRPQGGFYDFALRRRWTVYVRCGHPEMPRMAIDLPAAKAGVASKLAPAGQNSPLPEASPSPVSRSLASPYARPERIETAGASSPPAPPLATALAASPAAPVVTGAKVRLWKRDGQVDVELSAVALESGPIGAPVRVRLAAGGQVLRGVVRGAGSVELVAGLGFAGGGR